MAQIILLFAALAVILVLPVMFAARMLRAEKTGFGIVLVAVILQIILSGIVERYAPDQLIAIAIAIVGGSAIYSYTLDTTLLRGFFIGVIATVIAVLAIVILAGFFAVVANAA